MEHRETERALFRALHRFGKANTGQIVEMEGLTQGEFFGLSMLREHLKNHPEGMHVRELAQRARVSPPGASRMLRTMEEKGGDILKLAVTPWSPEDVLALLEATVKMKDNPSGRPLITMSMGGFGVVSRLAGEIFGSCMTFGCSQSQSAPGQIEAVPLAQVLDTIHQAIGE